jgi:hypothetical protein
MDTCPKANKINMSRSGARRWFASHAKVKGLERATYLNQYLSKKFMNSVAGRDRNLSFRYTSPRSLDI